MNRSLSHSTHERDVADLRLNRGAIEVHVAGSASLFDAWNTGCTAVEVDNAHTAGIAELKARHACRVTAPQREAQRIPAVDATVREGDFVTIGSLVGRVLETPGHTAGHISYWFKSEKLAFVGDTLFSVGCGRLLEGTADVMWPSLLKLRGLPPETEVYCGHEYTAANVHFALTIEPKNAALRARADEVVKLCDAGRPTIPSTIGSELQANPFLRADLPEVAAAVGLAGAPPVQVFAAVRARKDKF